MDTFLTCTMVFLMLLASFNLFVGVSNDAVNFLGSALGSKSARYNIVMGVAAAGVLLGCTFSSGMMEIARSGIFNPQLFTYWDVMLIFFAVMLTDVLLLDTFNSLGLPTSTTVSFSSFSVLLWFPPLTSCGCRPEPSSVSAPTSTTKKPFRSSSVSWPR